MVFLFITHLPINANQPAISAFNRNHANKIALLYSGKLLEYAYMSAYISELY